MFNRETPIENIALYMRVSTSEQAMGGFSLDAQLDKLRSYAKAQEWKITAEFTDGGFSGRNTRRPQYQEMINRLDEFDAILVLKMDRIHRNSKNFLAMMHKLEKKNTQFISMQESFDTSTAMGRFVMNILQLIAQLESEQIGERVAVGMIQKAKDKDQTFVGHRTPYGYKWDNENKRFIPDPEKLKLVKKVFKLYLKGNSMREISKEVGKANTTVKYYLHNCFYAGYERYCHYFRRIEGLDPLIDVKTFNEVQRLMRSRCHSHTKYEPMLIKPDEKAFSLDMEKIKNIPVINRAKHNYNF